MGSETLKGFWNPKLDDGALFLCGYTADFDHTRTHATAGGRQRAFDFMHFPKALVFTETK
jgi:hypothetical protein